MVIQSIDPIDLLASERNDVISRHGGRRMAAAIEDVDLVDRRMAAAQ